MNPNDTDSTADSAPSNNESLDFESYRRSLSAALAEIKQNIDKILEMKVKTAELELQLTVQHNPKMQAKLKNCRDIAEKCECLVNSTGSQ